MTNSRFLNRLGKICAVLAVTFILPVLGYAGTDNGTGNGGQNNGKQNGHDNIAVAGHDNIPVAPEANALWVLVPFFGAVLLFSARQLFRPKANQK
jgi:hypothetical protein